LGCPVFICPSFKVNQDDPASTFHYIADLFNKTAKRCAEEGLQFQYHIHGHEFINVNGTTGMQMILDQTDPALVFFEPDTMWIDHAGVDSVQWLRDHAERCRYIHLKDFKDRQSWADTEVGAGQLNIPAMIEIANAHNMPWFVVEQEGFEMPMMESVAISLKNLRRMMN
jgi:sugar phosphate isomerase/epimerase